LFQKFFSIVSLGFVASNHDSALFVKKTNARHIFLSLYNNDMIISGDDFDGIAFLKITLSHCFVMKDLVLLYLLGVEVASSSKGYLLSQSKYIADIFERAQLIDNKIVDIPLETSVPCSPSDDIPFIGYTLYRTTVGSLVYLFVTITSW